MKYEPKKNWFRSTFTAALLSSALFSQPALAEQIIQLDIGQFQEQVDQKLERDGTMAEFRAAVTQANDAAKLKRMAYEEYTRAKGTPQEAGAWKQWAARAADYYSKSVDAFKLQKTIMNKKYKELNSQFIGPIKGALAKYDAPPSAGDAAGNSKQQILSDLQEVAGVDFAPQIDEIRQDLQLAPNDSTRETIINSLDGMNKRIQIAMNEPGYEDVTGVSNVSFGMVDERENLRAAYSNAYRLSWVYNIKHFAADSLITIQKKFARHLLLKVQNFEATQPMKDEGFNDIDQILGN